MRTRTIPIARDALWAVVSDPFHLPRWWPRVDRVEDVTEEAWTTVTRSSRGRAVRADYTRVYADAPNRLVWRQELAETPFERFLREALVGVLLEDTGDGTKVELRSVRKLRGLARFGGVQMRRAARRELDEALDGLAAAVAA
ncbi:MAG: SRPBCC family protein [Thermoleophilaceae bacterium]